MNQEHGICWKQRSTGKNRPEPPLKEEKFVTSKAISEELVPGSKHLESQNKSYIYIGKKFNSMKYSLVLNKILIIAGCLMAVMVIHSGCNPA